METETEPQASLPEMKGTGLLERSSAASTLAMLRNLPARLDDQQLAQVAAIAKSDLPSLPPMTADEFDKGMNALSILPRRKDDETTGEVRLRIFRQALGRMARVQFIWIVARAIERSKFFPSIKELLDIGQEWKRWDDACEAQREARVRMAREQDQRQIDSTRRKYGPMTQEAVDQMDEAMKAIGLKLGALIEVDGKIIPNPEPEGAQQ